MRNNLATSATSAVFAVVAGTVTMAQTTQTAAQLAVEDFYACANSLFKDEFEPADIDYELSLDKRSILSLSVQWNSRDRTITILTRTWSIGDTPRKEMIMAQNGRSTDELPVPAAKVKEHILQVFKECPVEKEDYDCADAVIERFTGIEQVIRHNLEYPNVTVEKYATDEQMFRASKEVSDGIDDYLLVLNGAADHKSFGWRVFRPLTAAALEEVLHNPPPRVAKHGSDIRKLAACMETVTHHVRILPR